MAGGETVRRAITIAEGLNLYQIAALVRGRGIAGAEKLLSLSRNQAYIRSLGVRAPSLEGYLFPDTYYYAKNTPMRHLVAVMTARTMDVLAEACRLAAPEAACDPDGPMTVAGKEELTAHEILTLASIVEKETALPEERPLVAEVFLNRLRRGMRLQADPTVTYGLGSFGKPLTKRDLLADNPYNTYVHAGLPPGPICNPGRAAIEAVVRPAGTGALYFVANGRGGHVFSKTLAAHNRAVRAYRLRKNGVKK